MTRNETENKHFARQLEGALRCGFALPVCLASLFSKEVIALKKALKSAPVSKPKKSSKRPKRPLIPVCLVPLGGKHGKGKFAVIDQADAALVAKHNWALNWQRGGKLIYVQANIDGKTVTLHRLIAGVPGTQIDHVDHDTLNNRRANLEVTDATGNTCNRRGWAKGNQGYKGILRAGLYRWKAQITYRHVTTNLGTFDTPEEAAQAYDKAARKFHGSKAYLNFPAANDNGRR